MNMIFLGNVGPRINTPPVITIFIVGIRYIKWYVYHSQLWVVYDVILPT